MMRIGLKLFILISGLKECKFHIALRIINLVLKLFGGDKHTLFFLKKKLIRKT